MISHHRLLKKHIKKKQQQRRELQISIYAMLNRLNVWQWHVGCIMFCNSSACHLSFVRWACTPWVNSQNCHRDNIPHNNNNKHSQFHLYVLAYFNSKTICFVMFVECFSLMESRWKTTPSHFFRSPFFIPFCYLSKTLKQKNTVPNKTLSLRTLLLFFANAKITHTNRWQRKKDDIIYIHKKVVEIKH